MLSDIKEIKKLRKKFGLTQSELASISGVSQSLITKIESGKLDPKYSNATKIFSTLNKFTEKNETKASMVMQKKVISLSPEDDVIKAVNQMKRHGISQVPVIKGETLVGFVSDAILIDSILHDKQTKIKDIMHDPPPVVSDNTPLRIIIGILRFYPFVIVSETGIIKGIVTKADVLGKI